MGDGDETSRDGDVDLPLRISSSDDQSRFFIFMPFCTGDCGGRVQREPGWGLAARRYAREGLLAPRQSSLTRRSVADTRLPQLSQALPVPIAA